MRRSRYKELTLVIDLLFIMILSSSVRSQLSEDDLTPIKVCSVNKEPLWVYDTTSGSIYNIDIGADANFIIAGDHVGTDSRIYLFNRTTTYPKTPIWTYSIGADANSVDITADNVYITVGAGAGHFGENSFFNRFLNLIYLPLWNSSIGANTMKVSEDGSLILVSFDDKIYLFNGSVTTPKTAMWTYSIWGIPGHGIALTPDGEYIGVCTSLGGKMFFFNSTTEQPKTPMWTYDVPDGVNIDISSNGRYIVLGSYELQEGMLYVFNGSYSLTKEPIWTYNKGFYRVRISSNGSYIFAAGDKDLYVFNNSITYPKTPIWTYKTSENIFSMELSLDDKYLAVGADNLIFFNLSSQTPEIPIWESRLGDMLCEEGSCGVVRSIAISSLNHYIAVGPKSGHVMLFSPEIPSEVPEPNDTISFTNLFLLFIIFGIFIILLQLKKRNYIRRV